MATALGQILEIDQNTLENIDNVSKYITAIGDNVEKASKKFQDEFGKMNLSATTLNERLISIKNLLGEMGVDLTKPLTKNLDSAATSANTAAISITNAAKAMGEFGVQTQNAASKPNPFANLRYADLLKQFDDSKSTITKLTAELDATKQRIQTINTAMSNGRVDRERFTAELKEQAIKAGNLTAQIKLQQTAMSQMNAEINRRKTLYASENAQTKANIQNYRLEEEETQKLYRNLFDLAKAREENAKKKQEKADTAALKEEQRIYSQLEQQYIRLSVLKQKSIGTDGVVKDAANYQKIVDLMQKTNQEMQKMLANNPKLKQNELAIVAARQREVEVTQRLSREQDKLNQKKQKEYYESPKGALEFANAQMRSYQQRAQAIKYLETAMKNLDMSETKNHATMQQLTMAHQRLRKEQEKSAHLMGDLKNNMEKVSSTAKQLASTLGIVFSAQAITGYVKNLIEVRGEFELQNTALRAILQNKDEADRLFAQVTQLAIKSPYSIRQLTSYTKQLAAYRVESDKLYDTTKRLADVSSGLGVDMQRIILAYGQVKAANYLRATEVRQFTEAGINVLGELSKYYTELEGRMVSVADVQERITKRMVEFGDVEEIFRRMTDQGGVFYNMQAKQAETLKGMMMNLRDSLDIMLNDIGKSNEGIMKGSIRTLTDLIRNWREVMYVIKPVLGSFIALQASMKLYGAGAKVAGEQIMWFSKNIEGLGVSTLKSASSLSAAELRMAGLTRTATRQIVVIRSLQTAWLGLKGILMAIIPIAIVTLLVDVLRKLTQAHREAKRLNQEISSMVSDSVAEYRKSEAELKRLVEGLKDVNAGSYEHEQIIDKLNSQYGDYIGFLVDEKTTYDDIAGSLDVIIGRLKEKSAYEASSKILQAAYEAQAKSMENAQKALSNAQLFGQGILQRGLDEKEIELFLSNYEDKVKELGRRLSKSEARDVLRKTLGLDTADLNFTGLFGGFGKLEDYADSILRTTGKENDLQKKINEAYSVRLTTMQQVQEMERLAKEESDEKAKVDQMGMLSAFEREKQKQAITLRYQQKRLELELEFGAISQESYEKQMNSLVKQPELMTSINDKFAELAKNAGFTEEEYSKLLFTNTKWEKGLTSVEKQIKETWEAQGDIIAQQNRYKDQGLKYNEEELAQAERQQKLYALMAQTLGISLENEKKLSKEAKETAKERIDLLKQIRQEYEQNRKVMGEEEASAFTKSQFKDNAIFQQLQKMGVIDATLNVDSTGLITALERLAKVSGAAAQKEIQAMIATLNNEQITISITANMEGVKTEIEGLFDRLNLTKELEKLGLDKAMTEQLFGFETIDLKGLREQLEIIKAEYAKNNHGIGEEQQKYFAEMEKKITDQEQKELMERLKNYAKYLKMEASVAVQAKLDEARQLAELEATSELTAPQKEVVRTRIMEETREKVDKSAWDQFKNTDMYIRMFEDLDFVSTSALTNMENKLISLRDSLKNLDPQNLKEIENQLQKIQEAKMQKSPLQSMIDSMKEMNALRKEGLTPEVLEMQMMQSETQAENAEREIQATELIIGLREKGAQRYEILNSLAREQWGLEEMSTEELRKQLIILKENKQAAEESTKNASTNLNIYKKARKSIESYGKAMSDLGGEISGLLGDVSGLIQDITGESSDVLDTFSDITGIIGESASAVITLTALFTAMGIALDTSLGIIGYIIIALKAVIAIVSAIVNANDKQLEASIERSKDKVDKLEKSYEKLEEAINDAYDAGKLQAYNREMENTLKLERQEIENQIALYKARKGGQTKYSDEIKELKDAEDEIEKTLKENEERLIEKMGGFGSASNIASAAESFVDAWYDAFMETGDGLTALEGKFDEFIDNLVKRQAIAKIASKFLEPLFEAVDEAVAEDSAGAFGGLEVTRQELDKIIALAGELIPNLNENLKAMMESLGVTPGTAGTETGLSGLAEDYGQMTEATATVLASINESIRYFESDSNLVLHNIQNILTVPGENPFYLTMLEQARYTKEIRDALNAMTFRDGMYPALMVRTV